MKPYFVITEVVSNLVEMVKSGPKLSGRYNGTVLIVTVVVKRVFIVYSCRSETPLILYICHITRHYGFQDNCGFRVFSLLDYQKNLLKMKTAHTNTCL